jgi:hypothetical protein
MERLTMFLRKIAHETLPFAVVIEEVERVAFAYLLDNERIVSHVWLYNCDPISEVTWADPEMMPFPNRQEFIREDVVVPKLGDDVSVEVVWNSGPSGLASADIYVAGECVARLAPDSKPGWSVCAKKPGPLARPLSPAYGEY